MITPQFTGQYYRDTTTGAIWRSNSTTPGDWSLVVQDMQVAWTPTTPKLGEQLGFFSFGDLPPDPSDVVFNQTTAIAGFDLEGTVGPTTLSWPNLVTVDPTNLQSGYLYVAITSVTSMVAPLLQTVAGLFGCATTRVTALSFPSLTSVGSDLPMQGNSSLTSVNLPLLGPVGGDISWSACALLTTIIIPNLIPTNGKNVNANGCALNQATVDLILARCVANGAYVSGTVKVDGGTSSAPSSVAPGSDYDTLINRGVSVFVNP